jgi:hypothetical protein
MRFLDFEINKLKMEMGGMSYRRTKLLNIPPTSKALISFANHNEMVINVRLKIWVA